MTIYTPTYLYIKQHSVTKKLYFGKTIQDPIKYKGSGIYWMNHINKYGKQFVDTLWFCLFLSKEEITQFAHNFSKQNNIVESNEWANLTIETGLDGSFHTESTKLKISNSLMGNIISEPTRLKISEANKDIPKPDGFGENISAMKWYNNGKINVRSKIQPDSFVLGVCNTKKRSPETRAKSNGINKDKVTCYDVTLSQFVSIDKELFTLEKNTRYFHGRSKQYKLLILSEINSTPYN